MLRGICTTRTATRSGTSTRRSRPPVGLRLAIALLALLLLGLWLVPAAAAVLSDSFSAVKPQPFWLANTQPSSGDDMYVRNAMHQQARNTSDRLFGALASLLGGTAPTLNFVTGDSPHVRGNGAFSATPADNTVNVPPRALGALANAASPIHDWAVQGLPHEFTHLRQTPAVYASDMQAEGGAQAFADLVTEQAAKQANVPFTPAPPGFFDADYADYVRQVMDTLGPAWVLYQQFGRPVGPITYP